MNKIDELLEGMSIELLEKEVEVTGKEVIVDGKKITFGEFKRNHSAIFAAMKKVSKLTSSFTGMDRKMDVKSTAGGWEVTPDFGKTVFVSALKIK